jgi:sugar lactone lactonase YvrE
VSSGLLGASGNDFHESGDLFQSNIALNRISRIKPDGSVSAFSAIGIVQPVGILVHDNGNMYICNCGDNSIRRLDKNGAGTDFARGTPLFCPNGITQDLDGNIYVSNFSNGRVVKIDETGRMSVLVDLPGGNNGHLTYANGVLYVCSHGDSKIFEVKLDGSYRVLAGSGIRGNADGNFEEAQFSRPNGIVATASGDTLYLNSSVPVTDAGGRPLNPSLLRMITGVRDFTLSAESVNSEPLEIQRVRRLSTGLVVEIFSEKPQVVELRLYDDLGRTIMAVDQYHILSGVHDYQLDVTHHSHRMIILELSSENARKTVKLF